MSKSTALFSRRGHRRTSIRVTLPLSLLAHLLLIAVIAGGSYTAASDVLPEITVIRITGQTGPPAGPDIPPPPRGSADSPGLRDRGGPGNPPGENTVEPFSDNLKAPVKIPEEISEEPIDFAGLLADECSGYRGPRVPGGVENGGFDPILPDPRGKDPLNQNPEDPVKIQAPQLVHRVKPRYSPTP